MVLEKSFAYPWALNVSFAGLIGDLITKREILWFWIPLFIIFSITNYFWFKKTKDYLEFKISFAISTIFGGGILYMYLS